MKATIHQPQFIPWLGYFDKMDKADIFVLLDNVQYKKNEFQNRNRIKTPDGCQWLTVPVSFKFGDTICETKINHEVNWQKKAISSLQRNYGKAPFFKEYFPVFEKILTSEFKNLAEINKETIIAIKDILSINTEIIVASEMEGISDDQTGRLIDICRRLEADFYIAGAGAKGYMDIERFEKSGTKVEYQTFNHPVYPQLFGEFEPYLSAMDYIFNCGNDFDLIRGNN